MSALHRPSSFRRLGLTTEALAELDMMIAANPPAWAAQTNRAVVLMDLKRYDDALATCDLILAAAAQPSNMKAHLIKCNTLNMLGCYEKAVAACDAGLAVQGQSANGDVQGELLFALSKMRLKASSSALWTRFVNLLDSFPMLFPTKDAAVMSARQQQIYRMALVAAAAAKGGAQEWAAAVEFFDRAIAAGASDEKVLHNRQVCATNLRNTQAYAADLHADRETSLQRIAAVSPEHATLLARADQAQDDGRWDDAVIAWQAVIAACAVAEEYVAYNNMAMCLHRGNHPDEALATYSIATRLNPAYVLGHINTVAVLCELARYDEAIAAVNRALAIEPQNHQAVHAKLVCLSNAHRFMQLVQVAEDGLAQPDLTKTNEEEYKKWLAVGRSHLHVSSSSAHSVPVKQTALQNEAARAVRKGSIKNLRKNFERRDSRRRSLRRVNTASRLIVSARHTRNAEETKEREMLEERVTREGNEAVAAAAAAASADSGPIEETAPHSEGMRAVRKGSVKNLRKNFERRHSQRHGIVRVGSASRLIVSARHAHDAEETKERELLKQQAAQLKREEDEATAAAAAAKEKAEQVRLRRMRILRGLGGSAASVLGAGRHAHDVEESKAAQRKREEEEAEADAAIAAAAAAAQKQALKVRARRMRTLRGLGGSAGSVMSAVHRAHDLEETKAAQLKREEEEAAAAAAAAEEKAQQARARRIRILHGLGSSAASVLGAGRHAHDLEETKAAQLRREEEEVAAAAAAAAAAEEREHAKARRMRTLRGVGGSASTLLMAGRQAHEREEIREAARLALEVEAEAAAADAAWAEAIAEGEKLTGRIRNVALAGHGQQKTGAVHGPGQDAWIGSLRGPRQASASAAGVDVDPATAQARADAAQLEIEAAKIRRKGRMQAFRDKRERNGHGSGMKKKKKKARKTNEGGSQDQPLGGARLVETIVIRDSEAQQQQQQQQQHSGATRQEGHRPRERRSLHASSFSMSTRKGLSASGGGAQAIEEEAAAESASVASSAATTTLGLGYETNKKAFRQSRVPELSGYESEVNNTGDVCFRYGTVAAQVASTVSKIPAQQHAFDPGLDSGSMLSRQRSLTLANYDSTQPNGQNPQAPSRVLTGRLEKAGGPPSLFSSAVAETLTLAHKDGKPMSPLRTKILKDHFKISKMETAVMNVVKAQEWRMTKDEKATRAANAVARLESDLDAREKELERARIEEEERYRLRHLGRWRRRLDEKTQMHYYYHSHTGETRWDRPEGFSEFDCPADYFAEQDFLGHVYFKNQEATARLAAERKALEQHYEEEEQEAEAIRVARGEDLRQQQLRAEEAAKARLRPRKRDEEKANEERIYFLNQPLYTTKPSATRTPWEEANSMGISMHSHPVMAEALSLKDREEKELEEEEAKREADMNHFRALRAASDLREKSARRRSLIDKHTSDEHGFTLGELMGRIPGDKEKSGQQKAHHQPTARFAHTREVRPRMGRSHGVDTKIFNNVTRLGEIRADLQDQQRQEQEDLEQQQQCKRRPRRHRSTSPNFDELSGTPSERLKQLQDHLSTRAIQATAEKSGRQTGGDGDAAAEAKVGEPGTEKRFHPSPIRMIQNADKILESRKGNTSAMQELAELEINRRGMDPMLLTPVAVPPHGCVLASNEDWAQAKCGVDGGYVHHREGDSFFHRLKNGNETTNTLITLHADGTFEYVQDTEFAWTHIKVVRNEEDGIVQDGDEMFKQTQYRVRRSRCLSEPRRGGRWDVVKSTRRGDKAGLMLRGDFITFSAAGKQLSKKEFYAEKAKRGQSAIEKELDEMLQLRCIRAFNKAKTYVAFTGFSRCIPINKKRRLLLPGSPLDSEGMVKKNEEGGFNMRLSRKKTGSQSRFSRALADRRYSADKPSIMDVDAATARNEDELDDDDDIFERESSKSRRKKQAESAAQEDFEVIAHKVMSTEDLAEALVNKPTPRILKMLGLLDDNIIVDARAPAADLDLPGATDGDDELLARVMDGPAPPPPPMGASSPKASAMLRRKQQRMRASNAPPPEMEGSSPMASAMLRRKRARGNRDEEDDDHDEQSESFPSLSPVDAGNDRARYTFRTENSTIVKQPSSVLASAVQRNQDKTSTRRLSMAADAVVKERSEQPRELQESEVLTRKKTAHSLLEPARPRNSSRVRTWVYT